MIHRPVRFAASALLPAVVPALLAGCSFAPHYERPAMPVAATFKEEPGWRLATPSDDVAKGRWWALFGGWQLASEGRREGKGVGTRGSRLESRGEQAGTDAKG